MNDEIIDLLKIKIEKAKRGLPVETQNAIATVDWKMAILGMRAKKGYTFEQLGDLEIETELLLAGLLTPENYPKELEKRMGISRREANELVSEMNDLVFKKIREELVKNTERKKIFANRSAAPALEEIGKEKINTVILNSAGIEIIPETSSDRREEIPVTPVVNVPVNKMVEAIQSEEMLPIPPAREKTAPGELEPIVQPEELGSGKEEPVLNVSGMADTGGTHPVLAQKLSGAFQVPVANTDHSLENISKTNPSSYPAKEDPYRLSPDE